MTKLGYSPTNVDLTQHMGDTRMIQYILDREITVKQYTLSYMTLLSDCSKYLGFPLLATQKLVSEDQLQSALTSMKMTNRVWTDRRDLEFHMRLKSAIKNVIYLLCGS